MSKNDKIVDFLKECLEKDYDIDETDLKFILDGDFDSVRNSNIIDTTCSIDQLMAQ